MVFPIRRRTVFGATASALVGSGLTYWWLERSPDDLPEPPFSLPFDPSQAGAKVSVKFRVREYLGLTIGLSFRHLSGAPKTPRERLLVAGVPMRDATGRESDRDVAAAIQMRLFPLQPGTLESERRMVYTRVSLAGYMGEMSRFTLEVVRLRPGSYQLEVEATGPSRAEAPAEARLWVTPPPKMGPIPD